MRRLRDPWVMVVRTRWVKVVGSDTSWTSPVRPRSPALSKGRDSSGLFPSAPPSGPVAAAISQSRKRREDADLSIEKFEICESARRKVATAFATGPPPNYYTVASDSVGHR